MTVRSAHRAMVAESLRERDRSERRDALAKLGQEIRAVRRQTGEARKSSAWECGLNVAQVRAQTGEAFRAIVEEARAARDAVRKAARETCHNERGSALATFRAEVTRLEREMKRERAMWSTLGARTRAASKLDTSKRKEREETEVSAELSAVELAIYKRIRALLAKDKSRTQLESFQDWLHDHPEAVFEEMERVQKKSFADHLAKAKHIGKKASVRSRNALYALEEVPF